jgi:chorismate synthase
MSDSTHADFLASLADDHQRKLGEAISRLEDRVLDLLSGAPLDEGALFDLEWAVQARNELRQVVDQEYLQEVDLLVKEYTQVAERATEMLAEYGDFTALDRSVIQQLQSLTFQGFESVGDQYLTAVSKEIYDMTLVGTSFADAVKNVRETVGGNLKRYADQQVHDGLMQFNANANVAIGKQSGVTRWKYYGGIQDNSRSHCKKHAGKIYTEEQIAEIWSGTWKGKASGDPFVVRGGYRCQHHWRPVFDD